MTILLKDEDLRKHPSYDPLGYIFTHEGLLYRAIYPRYESYVLRLLESGLIDKLTENELFPESQVTDFCTSDCNLVIQHKRVPVVTLPYEWSFSMLQDAAKTVLRTNIIAREFGYQTRDAHGFNILFLYGTPLFVDLGSFVEIEHDFRCSKPGWWSYGEFMRFFYAPLSIWSKGDSYVARHALHGDQMPMAVYWRYGSHILRMLPSSLLANLEFVYTKYKALNTRSVEDFLEFSSRDRFRERIAHWVIWFSQKRSLPFSSVDLEKVYRQVERIKRRRVQSKWGSYQAGMSVSERHQQIVNRIKQLEVKTVLDLGGNAGLLARLILSQTDVEHVICSDYDENAIESLYQSLKKDPARIYPALLNFGISISDTKLRTVEERLRSEAVLALALTHHLLLSQGMTIDFILTRLRNFSSKYVFVEFMPMGCYSSQKGKIPAVPNWYNREWFRAAFERYFDVLEECQIGKNRILFIGRLRSDERSPS